MPYSVLIRGQAFQAVRLTTANYIPIALALFLPEDLSLENLMERKLQDLPLPELDLSDRAQLIRFSSLVTLRLARATISSEIAYRLRAIFPDLPQEWASYEAKTETGYLGLDSDEVLAIALELTRILTEAEKQGKNQAQKGFAPPTPRKPKPRQSR